MKYLQVITNNKNKFEEYKKFANHFNADLDLTFHAIEITEIQNNDINEIVNHKIDFVRQQTNKPFIIDDIFFQTTRYNNFPGANTKFINTTIGIDGWKKLFEEGDEITAIATIGFSYFNKCYIFNGKLKGIISFKNQRHKINSNAPLNNIFYIPEKKDFLENLINKKNFESHRKKAFGKFVEFIKSGEKKNQIFKDKIVERYNKRAENWDNFVEQKDGYVNYENNYNKFKKILSKIAENIEGEVLDVGCGTGQITFQIAQNLKANVIGIDISDRMINIAKKKKKKNLKFERSELSQFPNNYFNLIASRGILISRMPLIEVFDFLNEINRISKPESYFIFDFLQNVKNSGYNCSDKTEFNLKQLDSLMNEFGLVRIFDNGNNESKIGIAVYNKTTKNSLYFATGNFLKVKELNEALKKDKIKVNLFGVKLDEIKADSIEKIVQEKLKKSFHIIKKPIICTDGGIFIDTLNGFPGENSKHVAMTIGATGILKLLKGKKNRTAIRKNSIGYYDGKKMEILTAEVKCIISDTIRESVYESYELDKILIPVSNKNKNEKTYSEMPIKNRVVFTEIPHFINFIKKI